MRIRMCLREQQREVHSQGPFRQSASGWQLICPWRWSCDIVALSVGGEAREPPVSQPNSSVCAPLGRKQKGKRREPGPHLPWETPLPGCLLLRNIPVVISKYSSWVDGAVLRKRGELHGKNMNVCLIKWWVLETAACNLCPVISFLVFSVAWTGESWASSSATTPPSPGPGHHFLDLCCALFSGISPQLQQTPWGWDFISTFIFSVL